MKSALIYANIARDLRHVEKTAAIADQASWELSCNAKGATEETINASEEQNGQPFEQHSRSTVQAETEHPFVAAANPIPLAAAC